jgi:hypothetical protein
MEAFVCSLFWRFHAFCKVGLISYIPLSALNGALGLIVFTLSLCLMFPCFVQEE